MSKFPRHKPQMKMTELEALRMFFTATQELESNPQNEDAMAELSEAKARVLELSETARIEQRRQLKKLFHG